MELSGIGLESTGIRPRTTGIGEELQPIPWRAIGIPSRTTAIGLRAKKIRPVTTAIQRRRRTMAFRSERMRRGLMFYFARPDPSRILLTKLQRSIAAVADAGLGQADEMRGVKREWFL